MPNAATAVCSTKPIGLLYLPVDLSFYLGFYHVILLYFIATEIRGAWGNGGMPAGVFRCTDGELMLVVGNDGQYARTCTVLGRPDLATNPRYLKNNDRVANGKELMAIFAGACRSMKICCRAH